MVEFFSSWAKSLGLAIVIVSILEMLLPNNSNKKYVRMIMGIYVLFNIVSPFLNNEEIFDLEELGIETYIEISEDEEKIEINQESMDRRIHEIYIEELEKDIKGKIEKQGYSVKACTVEGNIGSVDKEAEITLIDLELLKSVENEEIDISSTEEILVEQIQKIKPVEIDEGNREESQNKEENISNIDIQNIKKFLIEEYGVSENCLVIK